ncbi:hypothetical protein [Methylibium rhizosphaerae]|jgi:hypothetical protein|uniref:hypothetical protein n=1 Tax=Methylibium rhizosphaerae TaxID=2570323 RepID=UPI00112712D9|nr:hypothetical protein [Methylibium rhizosphaerae]
MQAAQSAANAMAGYTDLFASLQTVQATVQEQIERFNVLMAEIKVVGNARQDEEGTRIVGNIALKLHRVHTLLCGGEIAATDVAVPQPQVAPAGSAAELDLHSALNEFSSLLATSQRTSQEVAALLASATEELAQLRAAAN